MNKWKVVSVNDIKAKEKRSIISGPFGSNISSKFFVEYGVPVIRGNNLSLNIGTKFIDNGFVYITNEKAKELNTWAMKGDLIFTAAGTIGQVGIITNSNKYIISNKQLRLRLDTDLTLPLFIYYYLASPILVETIKSLNTGSTIPLINLSVLKSLEISLPPLPAQCRIAAILSSLDDKIENNRKTCEKLEEIAQAIFKRWFVDFEFLNEEGLPYKTSGGKMVVCEELGKEIPKGWIISEINDVAEVIDCLHSKKPERCCEGYPYLQLNNIRDDGLLDLSDVFYISIDDYKHWISRVEVREGDCVITNVGRVGAVAQIPSGYKAAIGRNMTCIRIKEVFLYPTFLIECLLSNEMRKEIENKTDSGTILNALNVRSIPKLRFACSADIVKRFEKVVRPIRKSMEQSLEESRILSAIRDALLPKLMSGELVVEEGEE